MEDPSTREGMYNGDILAVPYWINNEVEETKT
jgi:hypothetical protein